MSRLVELLGKAPEYEVARQPITTTFNAIGIHDKRRQELGLSSMQFTGGSVRETRTGDTIVYLVGEMPFHGFQLENLLAAVVPNNNGVPEPEGTANDLILPTQMTLSKLLHRETTLEDLLIHYAHYFAPKIKGPYRNFIPFADRWTETIRDRHYEEIFSWLWNMRFVDFAQVEQQFLEDALTDRLRIYRESTYDYDSFMRVLMLNQDNRVRDELCPFIVDRYGLGEEMPYDKPLEDKQKTRLYNFALDQLSTDDEIRAFLREFYTSKYLSDEMRRDILMQYQADKNNALFIDPHTQRYWRKKYEADPHPVGRSRRENSVWPLKIDLLDEDTVTIAADTAEEPVVSLKLRAKSFDGHQFNWQVIDNGFTQAYYEGAMFAALAIKRDKQGRFSFLLPDKTMDLVRSQKIPFADRADAHLGEILWAYLAKAKTNGPESMALRRKTPFTNLLKKLRSDRLFLRNTRKQNLMTAQMLVFIALAQQQFLKPDNPDLQNLFAALG